MSRVRRPSAQTVAVLRALAAQPTVWRYGYELGQEVDLKAGSLYPILIRLTERGYLSATWEAEQPTGRPPRHLYRITAAGATLLATVPAADPAPAPAPRHDLRGAW